MISLIIFIGDDLFKICLLSVFLLSLPAYLLKLINDNSAKPIFWFFLAYFCSEIIFRSGLSLTKSDEYWLLAIISAALVFAYNSIKNTTYVIICALIEIFLIAVNTGYYLYADSAPAHWIITVLLNWVELILLALNAASRGDKVVYSRFYIFDKIASYVIFAKKFCFAVLKTSGKIRKEDICK